MNNNFDMATPIKSLPGKTNVNRLVENVENNIETLSNSRTSNSLPQIIGTNEPPQYNPNVIIDSPVINKKEPVIKEVVKESVDKKEEKVSFSRYILSNIKEYLIMILLFSLLAHPKINKILYTLIPYLNNFQSPIPSLLLRGLTFVVFMILIKKCS